MARRHAVHRHLAAFALALALAAPPAAAQQDGPYRAVTGKELFDGIMEGGLASLGKAYPCPY